MNLLQGCQAFSAASPRVNCRLWFSLILFFAAWEVSSLGDSGGEIDVICGYRTPSSNEFLRTQNPHTGVAQPNLRMPAEAIEHSPTWDSDVGAR